jgi:outer membrane protein OmpA-like peptidoglycan-associated protein
MTVAKSSLTPQPTTNRRENVVSVKFGNTAALAGVQSVSFIVHDESGKVVRRTTLKMNPGDTGARIVIPRSLKGARVRVVTTNQCGVSEGAPRGFNVRPGSTAITVDQKTNVPVLAGQIVLPQIDFAASEIALDAKDKVQLDQVIKAMKGKCGTLLVSGFSRHNKTDSNRYLQNLADFRAQAVANYLSGKNLNMWINYQGFIIKSNDKSAGANRRVALYWNPS